MNTSFGKLDWTRIGSTELSWDDKNFSWGPFWLFMERIHNFCTADKTYFYDKEKSVICSVLGYISNLEKLKAEYGITCEDDVDIVEKLYSLKNTEFVKELEGIFSVVIFDSKIGRGYIFQDRRGYNLPFYYSNNKNHFIFSTSLKMLLKNSSFKREFNIDAAKAFVYNKKTIPDKETLLKDVYKLLPRELLTFDLNSCSVETTRIERASGSVLPAQAEGKQIDSVRNSVRGIFSKLIKKDVATTLSSGFDTNLILHILKEQTDAKVKAFTLGGRKINEVPAAQEIVNTGYSGVKHVVKIIDENALDSLPDIIWRLEGYVYERGLTLQYELAKLLSSEGYTSVFLGECANQIVACSTGQENKLKKFIKMSFIGDFYYTFIKKKEPPMTSVENRFLSSLYNRNLKPGYYNTEIDYILKKSGIMLNSFGIEGLYPFLGEHVCILFKTLKAINAKRNLFSARDPYGDYTSIVKEEVGPVIAAHLEKIGGSTDIGYAFDTKFNLIKKIFDSSLIKEILNSKQIKKISRHPERYRLVILHLLYLFLFNELFISSKFDSFFDSPGISLQLKDFL